MKDAISGYSFQIAKNRELGAVTAVCKRADLFKYIAQYIVNIFSEDDLIEKRAHYNPASLPNFEISIYSPGEVEGHRK